MDHDKKSTDEQLAQYQWTDEDRKAIWDHLAAEMKAGNLRYVSDERRPAATASSSNETNQVTGGDRRRGARRRR